MRADGFCRDYLPWVDRYEMNDQEVLNCYVGPHRKALPEEWNSVPSQEIVTEPELIHWAGPIKPWGTDYILFRDTWQHYVRRYHERTGRAVPKG